MAKKAKAVFPLAPLPELMAWWKTRNVRGIIIGGIAASLLSRPRVTRDIDAMIVLPEEDWPDLIADSAAYGFTPRVPEVIDFARKSRMLLLHHQRSGIDVDIAFGFLPFEEEALARAVHTKVGEVTVPLPTPEDLIIMKAVAHRDQDWIDIESLLHANPDLDYDRIREWVRTFADALETPELLKDLEKRLPQRPRRKRKKK